MRSDPLVVIRISRSAMIILLLALALVAAFFEATQNLHAQKAQENFKEKFDIANENGGVGIATSSDGKYVFAFGPRGIMVSDDHGKTGSWVQTVRIK